MRKEGVVVVSWDGTADGIEPCFHSQRNKEFLKMPQRRICGVFENISVVFRAVRVLGGTLCRERVFEPADGVEIFIIGTHEYDGGHVTTSIGRTVKEAVLPVKNRWQCGSCQVLSTTDALEDAWARSPGSFLAEQLFEGCDFACLSFNGGLMDYAPVSDEQAMLFAVIRRLVSIVIETGQSFSRKDSDEDRKWLTGRGIDCCTTSTYVRTTSTSWILVGNNWSCSLTTSPCAERCLHLHDLRQRVFLEVVFPGKSSRPWLRWIVAGAGEVVAQVPVSVVLQ